jgi:putative two-component system response regulator
MPGLSGIDLLESLKGFDETIQVVMVSGRQQMETVRQCLRAGAYDYIGKPFNTDDLLSTVERALDRARLIRQNEDYRRNLERMVAEQTAELRRTRDIGLLTLARLAESRDHGTGEHLERMAAYSRRLGEELASGRYPVSIPAESVERLYKSSPLHDIGKVGIPDAILLKTGPLDAAERAVMRTHPQIGGDTLRSVAEELEGPSFRGSFLGMGIDIAYAHHERWDGSGYPRGLAGGDIPLAARIVAVADAYDAITSHRPYKVAHGHHEAVRRIATDRGRHFDPVLVDAFLSCHSELDGIRRRLTRAAPGVPRSASVA